MKKDDLILILIALLLLGGILVTIFFGGGRSRHGVGALNNGTSVRLSEAKHKNNSRSSTVILAEYQLKDGKEITPVREYFPGI